MAELKNPKHEKFVQNIVRGLSPTEAYISAGYSRKGAHASAARLLKNPQVCTRLAELQKAVEPILEQELVKLLVAERLHRIEAIQDRWDALREAKRCFAAEDYEGAMKTGVVCRKVRWIGGKDGREVVEYEINSALIEALNSVEKRGDRDWSGSGPRGYQPSRRSCSSS
jgi:phage terminase small subunit